MGPLDGFVFVAFVVAVVAIGLYKSKDEDTEGEKGASDYFLAGRGLTWWLVGFSLIAANISTEQFVGMSGEAAAWLGMAIASYEWMAAITLVVVAFVFLPKFLKSGIYTIPEFLEYRYGAFSRTWMAIATMIILVGVPTASVIYSGAKVITGNFQGILVAGYDLGNITVGCWIIGTLAAAYVFAGGLKACAWADLIQGAALIIGGCIIAYLAFALLERTDPEELLLTSRNAELTVADIQDEGGWGRFWKLNDAPLPEGKLHMKRPLDDPKIPWSALVLGLWIPNFFYWGLNQYITQRTLGSKSLAEGQKGVVFAALLKLIIPFIVVIPGILAFNLFNGELREDAVGRNAQIFAEHSPSLYAELSDSVKPNADLPRNKGLLAKIDGLLEAAPTGERLYKFDEAFAELHPEDAARIVRHNLRTTGADASAAPGPDAAAAELAEASDSSSETPEDATIEVSTLAAHDYDNAFPTLLRELLPIGIGLKGFVLAAIFGAVVSSLASMLNSASTIATMDIYNKIRGGNAPAAELVRAGRFFVVVFVLIAMLIAPYLGHPSFSGIFTFIQEFQGFISPGVLAIFLFGLLVHRAPRNCGIVGLVLSPVLYGLFKFGPSIPGLGEIGALQWIAERSFLDRMSMTFLIILAVLTAMTLAKPLKQPVELPVNVEMDMRSSRLAQVMGVFSVLLTIVLYYIFW
ncbi:Sodium/glucose cotransporter [Posidoniimonas polymericola]|uniref:Sodium/glucose cotransporter n=1 Tax=Posidoniimonas polymericola TaxID=2528002 RepID=A0A5C5YT38_9BACT|nr:sodium/solute symporter [Posidoniimonas polymericola]TWT78164.1 Sodium/glucose cotransporter [Posidoniimonas polymericola]